MAEILDTLNKYSENQIRCYEYLMNLRELMKGRKQYLNLQEAVLLRRSYIRTIPIYQGTCIKTRELENGIYDIQFWFRVGYSNVTWHEGITANVIY